jgi:2-dehydropantoate 2-reductase
MKIAIVGAGAIGGYVGVKLALAGEDVTFIVRGANLTAIRNNGMKLIMQGGVEQIAQNVRATDDYAEAGPQDLVILALKAHQVDAVADQLPKLFGPDTTVVTMQNGIPYWYFYRHGGELEGRQVHSVDPTGLLATKIPPQRVIGISKANDSRSANWMDRPARASPLFPNA